MYFFGRGRATNEISHNAVFVNSLVADGIWHQDRQSNGPVLNRRADNFTVLPFERLLRIVEVQVNGKPERPSPTDTVHIPRFAFGVRKGSRI